MSDEDIKDIVCFGGPLDGEIHHHHSDPPSGYKRKYAEVGSDLRPYYLYIHLNRKRLDESVVSQAIRKCHVRPK